MYYGGYFEDIYIHIYVFYIYIITYKTISALTVYILMGSYRDSHMITIQVSPAKCQKGYIRHGTCIV